MNFALGLLSLSKTCNTPLHAVSWLSVASLFSCSTLFLVRVCTVYHDSKKARLFFCIIWLIRGIASLAIPFSFTATPVRPGGPCTLSLVPKRLLIASLTIEVFDIIVYVAISYRTINLCTMHTRWQKFTAFFVGTEAGPVYKALLRTGQLYFMYVCTSPLSHIEAILILLYWT